MLDDPDLCEKLGRELLARADMLRREREVVADDRPVELNETDMAERLGIDPERLRKQRRAGNIPGDAYRTIGTRTVLYLVAQTELWASGKWAAERP
jgi:hypothetical protein